MSKLVAKKYLIAIVIPVISTILATLLIFSWKCCFCKPFDVSGKWEIRTDIQTTTHEEYIGLSVYYDVVIHQSNLDFTGTGEKISEKLTGEELYEYERINRVRIDLNGSVDNALFKKDRIFLHWIEHGRKRDTSSYFELFVIDENEMHGIFSSTAANSEGNAYFIRMK